MMVCRGDVYLSYAAVIVAYFNNLWMHGRFLKLCYTAQKSYIKIITFFALLVGSCCVMGRDVLD